MSGGGARHLARIHGTEEDKVNCPFFFKIGACRHGDRCSRIHHRPAFSQTILIKHIYRHPVREAELRAAAEGRGVDTVDPRRDVDGDKAMEDFLCFFEDFFMELAKFGRIDSLSVCDNLGDHMVGHVYCKFFDEEQAADALNVLNGRYYDGRKLEVEFSPVTDFREARCRDYDEGGCSRGGFCNFMHIKPVPMALIRSMEEDVEDEIRREEYERRESRRRRDRDRDRDRDRRDRRDRGDRDQDRARDRDRRERKRSRRDRSRSRSRDRERKNRSRSRSPRSRSRSRDRSDNQ